MRPMDVQDDPRIAFPRGEAMDMPDEVAAMMRLQDLGWGAKRIAAELGSSKTIVRRWRLMGGWQPCRATARATVRFETRPGEQLQIDFSERRVAIGGEAVKVFLFVAALDFSRRLHV